MEHGLPYLVNCSLLFAELPLLERPAAARAAGFDAVEFWWPFSSARPSDREVDGFVAAVRDAGVRLVAMNLAAGDMAAGDRGLLSLPGRQAELRASLDVALRVAAELGTAAFNVLYGNRVDGVAPQEQDELAAATLAEVAPAAAAAGAVLLLEPLSGAPRYPLRTAGDALVVLDRLRPGPAGAVRLLADLYHLAVNGDDLERLPDHVHRIGHVQVADAPGRHEPGTGELPLDRWLRQLAAAGYRGWVSLEYVPAADTSASLGWLPPDRRASSGSAYGRPSR